MLFFCTYFFLVNTFVAKKNYVKQQVVIRRTVKTLTYDAFSPKCENLQILNALIDIATPSWLIEKSTVGQRIGPRPDFTHDLRITVENML